MTKTFLTVAALMALTTAPSLAQDTYVSGQIGTRAVEEFDGSGPGASLDGELGNGFYFAAALGRSKGAWRYEAELANRGGSLNAFAVNGAATAATGDGLSATSLMANVYFDFGDGDGVTPYIGAGLGLARITADIAGSGGAINGDSSALAIQLIGGASMALSENTSLFADLRYFRAAETDFTLTAPLGSSDVSFQYDGYTLGAGLRIAF